MRKKNILVFGHAFATQFIDISNQYTQLFDQNKYQVTVVYLIDPENEEIKKRHLADEIIFLNLPKRSIRYLKITAIKKLLQLQREKKFEIVICHRYKPTYIMLWVAQFCRVPALIFVMHELNTMKSFSRKILLAALWRRNMYLAGVSNAVRDNLARDTWGIPQEKIITLYNAIDVKRAEALILSREDARLELNLLSDDFIVGTIGRLVPAKDHLTLIQSFALIKPKCKNAKLIIIGQGDLMPTLMQKINEVNLRDDIFLLGFVPQAFRLLKAFDLFVLSSIKEAFGLVLLEAMLAKVPIIATRAHGIPEVMGETGTLVEQQNIKALAEQIYLHYKMGANLLRPQALQGYKRAINEFSIDRFKDVFWQLPLLEKGALT